MDYIVRPEGKEEDFVTITEQEVLDIIAANEEDDVLSMEKDLRDLVSTKWGSDDHRVHFRIISTDPLKLHWGLYDDPEEDFYYG